jgi:hypothetical protein
MTGRALSRLIALTCVAALSLAVAWAGEPAEPLSRPAPMPRALPAKTVPPTTTDTAAAAAASASAAAAAAAAAAPPDAATAPAPAADAEGAADAAANASPAEADGNGDTAAASSTGAVSSPSSAADSAAAGASGATSSGGSTGDAAADSASASASASGDDNPMNWPFPTNITGLYRGHWTGAMPGLPDHSPVCREGDAADSESSTDEADATGPGSGSGSGSSADAHAGGHNATADSGAGSDDASLNALEGAGGGGCAAFDESAGFVFYSIQTYPTNMAGLEVVDGTMVSAACPLHIPLCPVDGNLTFRAVCCAVLCSCVAVVWWAWYRWSATVLT